MNQIIQGDCREQLKTLPDNSVDAIITDPPYELGFMGKSWDASGIAYSVNLWKECLRVLKPGGHLLAFSGTRTYHRMTCAIEDAGFEVRDMIEWCYGSGFPKSLNIGKAVDKLQGNEREDLGEIKKLQSYGYEGNNVFGGDIDRDGKMKITKGSSEWEGWGTALKPAHEPIAFCRKPIEKGLTIAENCLKWGVGGINIDGCRVEGKLDGDPNIFAKTDGVWGVADFHEAPVVRNEGRFPANLIHDNSEEVRACFPESNGSGKARKLSRSAKPEQQGWGMNKNEPDEVELNDAGSGNASRFFKSIIYTAKASKSERGKENNHPTVKPVALMEYLIDMVSNPGYTILDPFMGSGTTGVACKKLGRKFIGIELDAEYIKIAECRIGAVDTGLFGVSHDR